MRLKKSDIKKFPERIQKAIRDQLSVPVANLESNFSNGRAGTDPIKAYNQAVRVHFHSIRRRLADNDNLSGKAALDAIVESGILVDDSSERVVAVTHTEEKGSLEMTKIIIYEA